MRMTQKQPRGSESLSQQDSLPLEKLTNEAFATCSQATSTDSRNAISSQGSGDGAAPCASPGGVMIDLFGQPLCPASRSVEPESKKEQAMIVTSGLISLGSSASVALSQFLASRLREQLASTGSMEYAQTWKRRRSPLGRLFWEHTASEPRTGDSGSTGWPTPDTNAGGDGPSQLKRDSPRLQTVAAWASPTERDHKGHTITERHPEGFNVNLPNQVSQLAAWGTPNCMDALPARSDEALAKAKAKAGCANLKDQVPTAGWTTPAASEASGENMEFRPSRAATGRTTDYLGRQVIGANQQPSSAETESGAGYQLNPHFPLWLMGFHTGWHDAGLRALRSLRVPETQSSRKSPRNSSKRLKKQ